MPNPNSLANLRNILAELYDDVTSIRRIAGDAGLNLTRIALNSSAVNHWHAILVEAEHTNKVDALLGVVLDEYPENAKLRQAFDAYQASVEQSSDSERRFPLPTGGEVNTGGGTYVDGGVSTSGDFTGRDNADGNIYNVNADHVAFSQTPKINNMPSPSWNRLPTYILILIAVGVPTAAAINFADQVTQHPWQAFGLAIVFEIFVYFIHVIKRIGEGLENRWIDPVTEWFAVRVQRAVSGYHRLYLQHLIYRHRNFDVKGLTTQGTYTLELQRVFVELSIAPRPVHQTSTDPIRSVPEDLSGQHPIWSYLTTEAMRDQNLAIIGAPGSGKTTLLKHMVLALCGNRKQRRQLKVPDKLPVLLFLRDHAAAILENSGISLAQVIENDLAHNKIQPPPASWFETQLTAKRCLVLLDGLDEVADIETRTGVVQWVEMQMVANAGNRFVVTSRPHGYRTNPLSNVTVLEIQPFTQAQVEKFVHNWYRANEIMSAQKDDPGVQMDARKGAEDLLQRLRTTPTLAALAVNPLLLTMIATVHRYRSSLPGRRVELYAEVCEVFLGKRQQSKGLALDLTPAQKQRVLQPLAFYLMQENRRELGRAEAGSVISDTLAQVAGQGNPEACDIFLKSTEETSGLLLERESGVISFAHLAFQEYLAAVYVQTQRLENILVAQINNPWWHEIIRLYCAQADASPIIDACIAIDPQPIQILALAIECMEEAKEVKPQLRQKLEALLVEGIEDNDLERRRLIAETLLALRLRRMVRVNEDIYIDATYVTHSEYQLFLDEMRTQQKFHQPDHWLQYNFPIGQGHASVVGIRSADALAFCQWLSQRENNGWCYRLPKSSELASYGMQSVIKPDSVCGYWVKDDTNDMLVQFENNDIPCPSLSLSVLQQRGEADRARSRPPARAHTLDLALKFARELAGDRGRDLVYAPEGDRGRDLVYALELALELRLDQDLELRLDQDLAFIVGLDSPLEVDGMSAFAVDLEGTVKAELELALELALEQAQAVAHSDFLARDRSGALELELTFNRTLTTMRRYNRGDNLIYTAFLMRDLTRSLDSDRTLASAQPRALELARSLDSAFALASILLFDVAFALKLALNRSFASMSNWENLLSLLHWYIRFTLLIIISQLKYLAKKNKQSRNWWQLGNSLDTRLQKVMYDYLSLYVAFVILEERIEGNLPAFEGIRIVKDRVRT